MNVVDFIVIIIIGFFLTNFSLEKIQEGITSNKSIPVQIKILNKTNSASLQTVKAALKVTFEKYKTLNSKLTSGKHGGDELRKTLTPANHSSLTSDPPVKPLPKRPPKLGCTSKPIWPTGIDKTKTNHTNNMEGDKDFANMLKVRHELMEVYIDALFIEEAGNIINDNLQILTSGGKEQLKSIQNNF